MKPPKQPYQCETKGGCLVCTEIREHDKAVLVMVYHENDILKLMPVDTEDELAWWFWTYVYEWGGFAS